MPKVVRPVELRICKWGKGGDEAWALSDYYCPSCGKRDMWQELRGGGDYYHDCTATCRACGYDMCWVGAIEPSTEDAWWLTASSDRAVKEPAVTFGTTTVDGNSVAAPGTPDYSTMAYYDKVAAEGLVSSPARPQLNFQQITGGLLDALLDDINGPMTDESIDHFDVIGPMLRRPDVEQFIARYLAFTTLKALAEGATSSATPAPE